MIPLTPKRRTASMDIILDNCPNFRWTLLTNSIENLSLYLLLRYMLFISNISGVIVFVYLGFLNMKKSNDY